MPRFDQTGPMGCGAQTGRRMGICYGNSHERNSDLTRGWRGRNRGQRGTNGFGFNKAAGLSSEKESLEAHIKSLELTLETMKARLEEQKSNQD